MSEIALVTQNDEPALAFGEYEISADGETLYVGSAGVSDKDSEIIYRGQAPIKVQTGVFSRLASIDGTVYAKPTLSKPTVNAQFNKVYDAISGNVSILSNTNILVEMMEV